MEEKFFLPIFQTLPKSNRWISKEFFKQLQHEYRDIRQHTFSDFEQVWKMMEEAGMVSERNGYLVLTKKGRHILRQNYNTFTMNHFNFHVEHGDEYVVRFGGDSSQAKGFFENLLYSNIENLMIGLIFAAIVLGLSMFMGKGIMKTAFEPSIKHLENEIDRNMENSLDQAIPKNP